MVIITGVVVRTGGRKGGPMAYRRNMHACVCGRTCSKRRGGQHYLGQHYLGHMQQATRRPTLLRPTLFRAHAASDEEVPRELLRVLDVCIVQPLRNASHAHTQRPCGVVIAFKAMADMIRAHMVMANIVMACVRMAYTAMAYVVMAYVVMVI